MQCVGLFLKSKDRIHFPAAPHDANGMPLPDCVLARLRFSARMRVAKLAERNHNRSDGRYDALPQSFGFPSSWTGDESISRNPSGVPILDSCTAHGTFKAADLARLCDVLAAVINRAAFTRPIRN
jgi:hypothetical protein